MRLIHGDCLDALRTLPDRSVDAVVTDPPAGISFMGRAWDGDKGGRDQWIEWLAERLAECLRVLKPGGHAVVWALPRTSGWTHRALEDAGFEVRDCITHLFGQGFPKDRRLALKPAAEFWYLVRRPLIGTVDANISAYGTGGLSIDLCRVAPTGEKLRMPGPNGIRSQFHSRPWQDDGEAVEARTARAAEAIREGETLGRWPANVVLSHNELCNGVCTDGCAIAELDRQSGTLKSGRFARSVGDVVRSQWRDHEGRADVQHRASDACWEPSEGGASRFFPTFRYQAKPSTREKNNGLEHLADQDRQRTDEYRLVANSTAASGVNAALPRKNHHPTVKPVELMRWLVRLVTPPGGTVLDPFAGSGSTLVAATLEGFDSIGVEAEAEYLPLIEGRVRWAEAQAEQPALTFD